MKRLQLVIVCLTALAVGADDLRTVPFYRYGITSDDLGYANLELADITGDSRPEIISCSHGSPLALGYSAGNYVPVWHGPAVRCSAATAADADGDGATDVIVVNATGTYNDGGSVMLFDPRGFGGPKRTAVLPGNDEATDVVFGNVDFDAAPEIVVVTDDDTYVYDAATLDLEWTAVGYGGTDVFLGDIDGDARLEIVVNDSSFAAVLDAGNEVVKWGYAGGFGAYMAVGNVDADTKAEIVFLDSNGQLYTEITILNGDFTTSTIADGSPVLGIADANADGVNEIIVAQTSMRGLRPSDGAVLWNVALSAGTVHENVAVGDVDGDGSPEIAYGAGYAGSPNIMIVSSAISQTVEHAGIDLDPELYSATGDVDGDGRADLVVASTASGSGYSGGLVQILEPRTRTLKGLLSSTGFDIRAVAIGQLDDDAPREIIALCTDYSGARLVVWDGATHQIQWLSAATNYPNPEFLEQDFAVANVDGDAVDEIILGMSDGNLVILNGATPIIQASKNVGEVVGIEVADVDDDGTLEAVVGTTSKLYLLDTADWSVIKETPLSSIRQVAATAASGGRVAVSFEETWTNNVRLYDLQLTPLWTCPTPAEYNYYNWAPIAFADIGGETRLLAATGQGSLKVLPTTGGPACPASTTRTFSNRAIMMIHSADVTGDGWPELVLDTGTTIDVHLIGLATEIRGDADGDGSIGPQDIDELTDNLFGATPGMLPMADVNADERISPEDVFALIHYEYGGGPEPQP